MLNEPFQMIFQTIYILYISQQKYIIQIMDKPLQVQILNSQSLKDVNEFEMILGSLNCDALECIVSLFRQQKIKLCFAKVNYQIILDLLQNMIDEASGYKLEFLKIDPCEIANQIHSLQKLRIHQINLINLSWECNRQLLLGYKTEFQNKQQTHSILFVLIKLTSISDEFTRCGSNAAYLCHQMGIYFNNQNFSAIQLEDVDLSGVEFAQAKLKCSVFKRVNISGANFDGCYLEKVNWTEMSCNEQLCQPLHVEYQWARAQVFGAAGRICTIGYETAFKNLQGQRNYKLAISIWGIQSNFRLLQSNLKTFQNISSIVLSKNANFIAVSLESQTHVYASKYGKLIRKVLYPNIESIAFAEDESFLVACCPTELLRWNWCSGEFKEIAKIAKPFKSKELILSWNSRYLAFTNLNDSIHLFDLFENPPNKLNFLINTPRISCVRFAQKEAILATAGQEPEISVWDLPSANLRMHLLGHTHKVQCLCFSSGDSLLASGGQDASIFIWNLSTGQSVQRLCGHVSLVIALTFCDNCIDLISLGSDKTIRLWDLRCPFENDLLQGHTLEVSSLCYSKDGKILASAGVDNAIKLWEAETGRLIQTIFSTLTQISILMFSLANNLIAVGQKSGSHIGVVDLSNKKKVSLIGGIQSFSSSAISRDGMRFALMQNLNHCIYIWNLTSGSLSCTINGYQGFNQAMAFSSDSKYLAACETGSSLRVWLSETGAEVKMQVNFHHECNQVQYSQTGHLLAASLSTDCSICLINIENQDEVRMLQGHESSVRSMAFSHDNQLLASCSYDLSLRIWNILTLEQIACQLFEIAEPSILVFSQGEKYLAAGGSDKSIRIFKFDSEAQSIKFGEIKLTRQIRSNAFRGQQVDFEKSKILSSSKKNLLSIIKTQQTLYG